MTTQTYRKITGSPGCKSIFEASYSCDGWLEFSGIEIWKNRLDTVVFFWEQQHSVEVGLKIDGQFTCPICGYVVYLKQNTPILCRCRNAWKKTGTAAICDFWAREKIIGIMIEKSFGGKTFKRIVTDWQAPGPIKAQLLLQIEIAKTTQKLPVKINAPLPDNAP